jgi:hypothetical protein
MVGVSSKETPNMTKTTEITVSSKQYEDSDDCLSAAAQDYAEEHGIERWLVEARWADNANREEILITIPADMVTIETMPDWCRASHRAAGNWGRYPLNGAERRKVSRDEAEEIVAADEDGYDHIVEEA